MTDEVLITAFTFAEAPIKSRPLTYHSANLEDNVNTKPFSPSADAMETRSRVSLTLMELLHAGMVAKIKFQEEVVQTKQGS